MVFRLPSENTLRLKMTYTDIFLESLYWNIGIFIIIFGGIFVILFGLKTYFIIKNKKKQQIIRTSVQSSTSQITTLISEQEKSGQNIQQKQQTQPNIIFFKILYKSTSVFFYIVIVLVSLIFLAAFMFGKIGKGTGKQILASFILSLLVIIPTILWKYFTKTQSFNFMKKQLIITIILLSFWVVLSVLLVKGTKQACTCAFNDQYGIKVTDSFQFSTQFTRAKTIGKICKDNQICNLYSTLPQDSDTAVFINLHTGKNINHVQIGIKTDQEYQKDPDFTSFLTMNKIQVGNTLQQNGQRHVYSVLITNLLPQTLYVLKIIAGTKILITKYKTLPNYASQTQLRIAFGGDVGMTQQGQKLISLLTNFQPDAIILGGDIAYDDAMLSCYYSWDTFYYLFNPLYNNLGRLVPMIFSIGNHDVGFDALNNLNVTQNQQGPLFFSYNPQHYADPINKNGIPKIGERKSFHYHKLGKTIHLNLDSGYIHYFQEQNSFIQQISRTYSKYQKFANYHNPIYPSCSDPNYILDINTKIAGRQNWAPLFERFNFTASMQHHTHQLKITKPIFNGTASANNQQDGVIYIGDGSLGVYNQPCQIQNRVKEDIFTFMDNDNSNHIWLMTVEKNEILYTAKNIVGQTITQYRQKFKIYPFQ